MHHRQKDQNPLISSNDVAPLLAAFAAAGWAIDEAQLRAIARDTASSNHWKDLIQMYFDNKASAAKNKKPEKPAEQPAQKATEAPGSEE